MGSGNGYWKLVWMGMETPLGMGMGHHWIPLGMEAPLGLGMGHHWDWVWDTTGTGYGTPPGMCIEHSMELALKESPVLFLL